MFSKIRFTKWKINGVDFVAISARSSDKSQTINLENQEVVDGKFNDALIYLVEKHLQNHDSTYELKLYIFLIDADLLKRLKNAFRLLRKGCIKSLEIAGCNFAINQAELEEFLCFLELDKLVMRANIIKDTIEITEKILSSAKMHCVVHEQLYLAWPKVTDNLLNHWKEQPPKYISLMTKTSFTLESVTKLIKMVFEKGWQVKWCLGVIECHANEANYLVELQKIRGTTIGVYNLYTTVTQCTTGAQIRFSCDFV